MSAKLLPATADAIDEAAAILRAGGLVAMPTETVYGLAADAANPDAVARLYAAKGRPRFNPLIAHVSSIDIAAKEGAFSDLASCAAAEFWPGALTLVLPLVRTHTVCDLARAGLDTIALRCPDHPVAQNLLRAFGGPLVAPSANPSGHISPTTAAHVAADLGDRLDLILDGGPCARGVESTIIGLTDETPTLLRPGPLSPEEIEKAIGVPLSRPAVNPDAPNAPGQLTRHYAPNAALRLNATRAEPGEALIGFGDITGDYTLSATGNLTDAAACLFAILREADAAHDKIAVAPIPNHGLGEAINDRLERAAKRD